MRSQTVKTFCQACGAEKRSAPEHNLLFVVIEEAFQNWPEAHPFRPVDAEHLRAWLCIEADHVETMDVSDLSDADPAVVVAMAMFFTHGKKNFRLKTRGNRLIAFRPMTLKKRELGVHQFRVVERKIFEIIETITGISVDTFKASRQQQKPVLR